jgi:hypothetical protein
VLRCISSLFIASLQSSIYALVRLPLQLYLCWVKHAFIIVVLLLCAEKSQGKLPFDSVIVKFNNYPCHHHIIRWYDGVKTYESEVDLINSSTINFSFDSTNFSGDTTICYDRKTSSWQSLRIVYDSITSTIKYFDFVQLFKYQKNPTERNYSFNDIAVVSSKDSLVGSISGNNILGANVKASDHTTGFIYGPHGQNNTSWQDDYVYLGTTTTDSTFLTFQMLAAFKPPLTVNKSQDLKPAFYPNPAKDRILFTEAADKNVVHIYDMLGKLVLKSSTPEADVSMLGKGIYRVEVSGKTHSLILH